MSENDDEFEMDGGFSTEFTEPRTAPAVRAGKAGARPCPALTMVWASDASSTRVWGCRLDVDHSGKHQFVASSWAEVELLPTDPQWVVWAPLRHRRPVWRRVWDRLRGRRNSVGLGTERLPEPHRYL